MTPAAVIILLMFSACATTVDNNRKINPVPEQPAEENPVNENGLTPMQDRLVEAAYWARGRSDVSCNNHKFALDCSGVISAVYWKAGIDLQAAYPLYTGSGVTRIYRYTGPGGHHILGQFIRQKW